MKRLRCNQTSVSTFFSHSTIELLNDMNNDVMKRFIVFEKGVSLIQCGINYGELPTVFPLASANAIGDFKAAVLRKNRRQLVSSSYHSNDSKEYMFTITCGRTVGHYVRNVVPRIITRDNGGGKLFRD